MQCARLGLKIDSESRGRLETSNANCFSVRVLQGCHREQNGIMCNSFLLNVLCQRVSQT